MNSSKGVNPRAWTCDQVFNREVFSQEGLVYLPEQTVPYRRAWQWQRQLVERYKIAISQVEDKGDPAQTLLSQTLLERFDAKDRLLLLQHPPVYTLGQGADTRFLRFDPGSDDYEIHRVERGGEVTYHCPGQLVGYPILNLKAHKPDLHWYLRQLEEVLIRTLACYGLVAGRVAGLTGVWYEGHKIAAIGIKVSRWITMHGFALNVCPDLSGFEKIVPCGIEGRPVGSMAQFLPDVGFNAVEFNAVRQVVIEQFEQVFGLRLAIASPSESGSLTMTGEDYGG
ncbi:MAG: lipoyl(octanoyl) transferase LipB [Cyanobacteria bacterium J06621_11]